MLEIEDSRGKKDTLNNGQRFAAGDRQGNRYEYRYEGIENTENGFDIHLRNLTTDTETWVERAWFRNRVINVY
ncbi:MAG: hypothetical protein Q4C58_03755 [Eubacteriales bacterium]|nr:hypothetical protein [Eubacteriales bacterium]